MSRPRLVLGLSIVMILVGAGFAGIFIFNMRHSSDGPTESLVLAGKPSAVPTDNAATDRPASPLPLSIQPPNSDPANALPHPSQLTISPTLPTVPIENQYLARFVDKSSKGPRVTANLSTTIPRVELPNEVTAVVRVLNDSTDDDSVRNEAINLLRRSDYAGLTNQLIQILNRPIEHERFKSFTVQFLGLRLNEKIVDDERLLIIDRLVVALSDPYRAVRREALMALLVIKHEEAARILTHGLTDPQWTDARDQIIRGLFRENALEQIPAIRPLAYDADSSVRIAALYVLGQWRDSASRPAFEDAQRSNDAQLRKAGALALSRLETSR